MPHLLIDQYRIFFQLSHLWKTQLFRGLNFSSRGGKSVHAADTNSINLQKDHFPAVQELINRHENISFPGTSHLTTENSFLSSVYPK